MSPMRRCLLALGLTFGTVSAAHAWEPGPREPPAYQTTVTRVLDVARGQWGPAVALAESPAPGCAALSPPARLNDYYGDAWVLFQRQENGTANAGEMLAIALAARAQNLQVRIFLMNWNGECVVSEIRTCSDPVACALPPAR